MSAKNKSKARKHESDSKRRRSSKASTWLTASPSTWIRIERPFPLPRSVRQVIDQIELAGFPAYIVGGSVRDLLMGREATDHDVATSATPDELMKIFPEALGLGKAFGVIELKGEELEVQIATFREDIGTADHRHPKAIRFAGPEEDARRRDFTINALFYDTKTGRVLDTVGGIQDIKAGTIRAIGEPELRFREDALRLLRAVRFSSTLGFVIDPETFEAAKKTSALIRKVSAERIRDELGLMLTGPNPRAAIELSSKLGLLKHILPELESMKGVAQSPVHHPEGDVWEHTLLVLGTMAKALQRPSERPSLTLAWGALLHDVGKPIAAARSDGKNFNGHEHDGVKIGETICKRLHMSRFELERVSALIRDHLKFKDVFQMRESTLTRWVAEEHFEELLELHRSDALSSDGNLAFHDFCEARLAQIKVEIQNKPSRLLSGDDLILLGLDPGPEFAQILTEIEDLALEKTIKTKEEALDYVLRKFVK